MVKSRERLVSGLVVTGKYDSARRRLASHHTHSGSLVSVKRNATDCKIGRAHV